LTAAGRTQQGSRGSLPSVFARRYPIQARPLYIQGTHARSNAFKKILNPSRRLSLSRHARIMPRWAKRWRPRATFTKKSTGWPSIQRAAETETRAQRCADPRSAECPFLGFIGMFDVAAFSIWDLIACGSPPFFSIGGFAKIFQHSKFLHP